MAPIKPRSVSELHAWITASSPFHNIDHFKAPFPDVNDFSINELEDAMIFAIVRCKTVHNLLGSTLNRTRKQQANEILIHAMEVGRSSFESQIARFGIHPGSNLPDRISKMTYAAKFADDITFQNSLTAISCTIRKLRRQISKVEGLLMESEERETKRGDEDDWFAVKQEQVSQEYWGEDVRVEQQKLFEAIEEHFKCIEA